jgi:hypothetical protein
MQKGSWASPAREWINSKFTNGVPPLAEGGAQVQRPTALMPEAFCARTNVVLRSLVEQLQFHRTCTDTCRIGGRGQEMCRFGLPGPIVEKTIAALLQVTPDGGVSVDPRYESQPSYSAMLAQPPPPPPPPPTAESGSPSVVGPTIVPPPGDAETAPAAAPLPAAALLNELLSWLIEGGDEAVAAMRGTDRESHVHPPPTPAVAADAAAAAAADAAQADPGAAEGPQQKGRRKAHRRFSSGIASRARARNVPWSTRRRAHSTLSPARQG